MNRNQVIKIEIILALVLIFLLDSYCTFTAYTMTMGIVITYFESFLFNVPFAITGFSFVFYSILLIKETFIRKPGRVRKLVDLCLFFVLNLFSVIMYIVYGKAYLGNFNATHSAMYIIFPILSLLMVLSTGYSFFLQIKNSQKEEKVFTLFPSYPTYRRGLDTVLLLFAFFSFTCLFLTLNTIHNSIDEPLGYITFLLSFLVIVYDVIYEIVQLKKPNFILDLVTLILNAITNVLMITSYIVNPNFIMQVAKPYTLIDFAGSFNVLPLLICIAEAGIIIATIIRMVKRKRKN